MCVHQCRRQSVQQVFNAHLSVGLNTLQVHAGGNCVALLVLWVLCLPVMERRMTLYRLTFDPCKSGCVLHFPSRAKRQVQMQSTESLGSNGELPRRKRRGQASGCLQILPRPPKDESRLSDSDSTRVHACCWGLPLVPLSATLGPKANSRPSQRAWGNGQKNCAQGRAGSKNVAEAGAPTCKQRCNTVGDSACRRQDQRRDSHDCLHMGSSMVTWGARLGARTEHWTQDMA